MRNCMTLVRGMVVSGVGVGPEKRDARREAGATEEVF